MLKQFFTSVYAKHRPNKLMDYSESVNRAENKKLSIVLSKNKLFLLVQKSHHTPEEFNKVCNVISEYGIHRKYAPAKEAFLKALGIGIGVGEANMELLRKMCGKALPLAGTKFTEFFKWLSNSLSMVSKSKEGDKVNISEGSDAWMSSFEI